ncbi:MAG: hypothetical protein HY720_08915 [Planctomycetes bacterium]|nr:hypothetical protein [Planctomycetota bacterium]
MRSRRVSLAVRLLGTALASLFPCQEAGADDEEGGIEGLSLSRSLDTIDLESGILVVAGQGLLGYRSLADYATLGIEPPARLMEEMRLEATVRLASRARKMEVEEKLPTVAKAAGGEAARVQRLKRAKTAEEAEVEALVDSACDLLLAANFSAAEKFLAAGFRINDLTFEEALKVGTARLGEAGVVDVSFPSHVVRVTEDEAFFFFVAKIWFVKTGPTRTRTLSGRVAFRREGEAWLAVSAEVQ